MSLEAAGDEGWWASEGLPCDGKGLQAGKGKESGSRCQRWKWQILQVCSFILWPFAADSWERKPVKQKNSAQTHTHTAPAHACSLRCFYPRNEIFLRAETCSHVHPERGIADNLICRKCWFLHTHSAGIFPFPSYGNLTGQELDKQNKVIPSEPTPKKNPEKITKRRSAYKCSSSDTCRELIVFKIVFLFSKDIAFPRYFFSFPTTGWLSSQGYRLQDTKLWRGLTALLKDHGLKKLKASSLSLRKVLMDAGQRRKSKQKIGNHCPVAGRISQTVLFWTIPVPQYIRAVLKSLQRR